MLKRMLPKTLQTMTAASLMMYAAATANADISAKMLDQVPADSQMFVVVSNLADVNSKIAKLSQASGLSELSPEMNDVLGQFKMASGLEAGVNDNGAMIFVIGLDDDGMNDDKTYWFVPVSDYGAFAQSLGGDAKGISSMTLEAEGDTFGKQVGDYALLSPSRVAIEDYVAGKASAKFMNSVGKAGQKYVSEADAMFYVDAPLLAKTFAPMIMEEMDDAVANPELQDRNPAEYKQMMLGFQMIKSWLSIVENDVNGVAFTAKLDDGGVNFAKAVGFKKGSELASWLPGGKSMAEGMLNKLPSKSYILATSVDFNTMDMTKLIEKLAEVMKSTEPEMAKTYETIIPLIEMSEGQAAVMYVPDQMAMMSGGFLNQVTVLKGKKDAQLMSVFKNYMAQLGAVDGGDSGISFETSWTDDALQLDGAKVAQYSMQIQMPPEAMQQNPMAMMFAQGVNGYVAAKGDYLIQTTMLDQVQLTEAIKALDANNGIGTQPTIVTARSNAVPANSSIDMYLSLGGIAEAGNMFIPMLGMPPIQVPANLTPIAGGMAVEGDSVVASGKLPIDNVKFIVDTAKTFMMQQQMMGAPGMMGEPDEAPPAPFY